MFSQPNRIINQFHWPMDEGAGADPTGGEVTEVGLRETNKQLIQPGDVPPMMRFHGSPGWAIDPTMGHYITTSSNNYVRMNGSSRCEFASNSFSILVWVRFSGTSYNFPSVVAHVRGSDSRGWAIRIFNGSPNTGAPYFFIYDATNIAATYSSSVPTINDGKWHFLAATCDRTAQVLNLTIDAKTVWASGSTSAVGSLASDATAVLRLAQTNEGGTTAFPGDIADLTIYTTRAITNSEIQRHYRNKLMKRKFISPRRILFTERGIVSSSGGGNNAVTIIG